MIRKIDSETPLHVHPAPNHVTGNEQPVRVLIAYGTRHGATADTAEVVSKTLDDEYSVNVDLLDLKTKVGVEDLQRYDAVIIGSSIVMSRWTKEARNFLKLRCSYVQHTRAAKRSKKGIGLNMRIT